MSDTVEKLKYLKETKKAIKNALIERGMTVSDTDTFRSYADKILEIPSGSSDLVKYVTFMSWDGTEELFVMPVLVGDDCKDPVTRGDIETPTKESTNTQNFTHSGWALSEGGSTNSLILKSILEDTVVYAAFTSSTRYYTVNFYDGDTLLKTMNVEYGGTANYIAEKDGYGFDGWEPSNENIVADTNCYAKWAEQVTFANASWEQIAEICANGEAENYFSLGDTKTITRTDNTTFDVVIAAFNHDDLSDGSGKANMTLLSTHIIDGLSTIYTASSSTWWGNSTMRKDLQNEFRRTLPESLRNAIKTVDKKSTTNTLALSVSQDTLWIPSATEVGITTVDHEGAVDGQGACYTALFDVDTSLNSGAKKRVRTYSNGNPGGYALRTRTKNNNYLLGVGINGNYSHTGYSEWKASLVGFCV